MKHSFLINYSTTFKVVLFCFIIIFFSTQKLQAQSVHVAANDSHISFRGILYPIKSEDSVILNRHSSNFFSIAKPYFPSDKGRTQSGVVISFKTASPLVSVHFKKRVDAIQGQIYFGVYRDKIFVGYYKTLKFIVKSSTANPSTWDIVLPALTGVHFLGLDVEPNYPLLPIEPEAKKQYIAIGNSITHGSGQRDVASDSTYPYLLAEKMGWRLYNLAVAASRITSLIVDETTPIKADVITVLWGFNDWNSNKNMLTLQEDYKSLLSKLRDFHSKADIYCIMPITTTKIIPQYGGEPIYSSIDTLRNTERRVVQSLISKGDSKMFLIEGADLTTVEDLRDGIHLNNSGATSFASKLVSFIQKNEEEIKLKNTKKKKK